MRADSTTGAQDVALDDGADSSAVAARPRADGKFLFLGERKLWVRGVTYGTFRPRAGTDYPDEVAVECDFLQMAANGVNAVRTYTVPPRWMLDLAARHGLHVLVGVPWEQHVTFLDDRRRMRSIAERVRDGVRQCAGHPAILGYAVGNEIPAPIVRWHGRRRVERFLRHLYDVTKEEDPTALATYVNYPTTEYLELPFDFLCFNVYLEAQRTLEAYLARLHNLAGDRPLVMAEIGLDSRRHGVEPQARTLDWQVRTAFAEGCAGAFVFSWTDEWFRGGHDIDDWDFGLTDRRRRPKPALAAVRAAFREVPFPDDREWPTASVVVCAHNAAHTLPDCLEGLRRLEYPDYEVIVVDDGSTDATAEVAARYDVRLIQTENRGLSSARNTGLEAAEGEIVAYLDADAWPDPHWLSYLAAAFARSSHGGIGGPNIPPRGAGRLADCVANAPGAPMHVLFSDREAEHIPGCNSAFRKSAAQAVGGWDPRFRVAGDDVDLCWRLQERGWTLGFAPPAAVWHHRRGSIRGYWCQQKGYGRAEALLEEKWPEKYNGLGHMRWSGRIYGQGLTQALLRGRRRVYHGVWGNRLFQSIYEPASGTLGALPLTPEWYLAIAALAGLSLTGLLWAPLLAAVPLLVLAVCAVAAQAVVSARRANFSEPSRSSLRRLGLLTLTAALHVLQPAARLAGRLDHGLTPWRRRAGPGLAPPYPRSLAYWTEAWRAPDERLVEIERALRDARVSVRRGGEFDRWELETRGGLVGSARLRMVVEEHGAGRQLARFRLWPHWAPRGVALMVAFAALAVLAGMSGAAAAAAVLSAVAVVVAARALLESARASAALVEAVAEANSTDVALGEAPEREGATGAAAPRRQIA